MLRRPQVRDPPLPFWHDCLRLTPHTSGTSVHKIVCIPSLPGLAARSTLQSGGPKHSPVIFCMPSLPGWTGPKHVSSIWRPVALSRDLLYTESPRLDRPEARFVHLAARSTLQRSFVSRVTPVPDRPEACPVRNLYTGDHPVS